MNELDLTYCEKCLRNLPDEAFSYETERPICLECATIKPNTVKQLISDLKKWHDGDAPILYQYITSEHGVMNEAEFVHVAEWLDRNDQFGDAMSELMNEWINEARRVLADVSPCCNAPLFSEICEACYDETEFVPVCEVCGQVDERQDLRRCVKHERICFGCDYLKISPHETMMDDGTVVLICDECHNRTTGGNE